MATYNHKVNFSLGGVELTAYTTDGFVSTDGTTDSDGAERLNRFLSEVVVQESDTGTEITVTPTVRAKVLVALRELGVIVFDSEQEASSHPFVDE